MRRFACHGAASVSLNLRRSAVSVPDCQERTGLYGITLVAAAASKLHLDSHRSFKYTPTMCYSTVLRLAICSASRHSTTVKFKSKSLKSCSSEQAFKLSTRGRVDCAVILPLQRGCPGCEATSSVRHVTLPHGLTIQLTIENQENMRVPNPAPFKFLPPAKKRS
ncbi:hypothetical protein BJV77DRAFT_381827 [Russula vinacea]|nr:hypothetical protein BJV77DRAFT_381827 [Russula vinacea]